jgi:hypothetical protein
MPMLEKIVSPPHPVVFITDPTRRDVEVPRDVSAAMVCATATCISVGTLAAVEGETTIRLGAEIENPIGHIAFDQIFETPGLKIEVSDSHTDPILTMDVPNKLTRLTIWLSHPKFPDIVQIRAQ